MKRCVAFPLLAFALVACNRSPSDGAVVDTAPPPATAGAVATPPGNPAPASAPAAPTPEPAPAPTTGNSRYTPLGGGDCKLVKRYPESGGSRTRCPGEAGYQLVVVEGDARMSIDVVTPDGTEHPLELWSVASGGAFSDLGEKAEWRFAPGSAQPQALIVRYPVYEQPERPEQATSYLVVAKLSGARPCVVAKIAPGPDQNLRARELADEAMSAPCLRAPG